MMTRRAGIVAVAAAAGLALSLVGGMGGAAAGTPKGEPTAWADGAPLQCVVRPVRGVGHWTTQAYVVSGRVLPAGTTYRVRMEAPASGGFATTGLVEVQPKRLALVGAARGLYRACSATAEPPLG